MENKRGLDIIRSLVDKEIFTQICQQLAGRTVYFPSNFEWLDKSERDAMLREDFYNGNFEISDLARKYDLSVSRVYKIIQHRK